MRFENRGLAPSVVKGLQRTECTAFAVVSIWQHILSSCNLGTIIAVIIAGVDRTIMVLMVLMWFNKPGISGAQAHHVLSVSHMKIKACSFSLLQFITLYKLNKS